MRLFTIANGIWPKNRRIYLAVAAKLLMGGGDKNPNHVISPNFENYRTRSNSSHNDHTLSYNAGTGKF